MKRLIRWARTKTWVVLDSRHPGTTRVITIRATRAEMQAWLDAGGQVAP